GRSLIDRLMVWDAGWFTRVAEDGYETGYSYDAEGRLTGNGLAFFPVYPLLIRLFSALPWMTPQAAALTVSWIAGGLAAVLLSLLGTELYSGRAGYALAVLFGAQPMSVVLSMGYSEAIFCAFVVAALLALRREAWLVAGCCALLASLTRPTGMALAAAIVVYAAVRVWRRDVKPGWRVMAGTALAVVGAPSYLLWVGLRVGDPGAWFVIQEVGWGTHWDYGASTFRFLRSAVTGTDWVPVSVAVILVAAVVALLAGLSERVWLPLSAYGVLAFAMAVGSAGYYHSRPRMLVPVLLILVPFAIVLGRCRTRTAVAVLVGITALGTWYGAYMITVWPFTI
ncbi:MAG: mannosyltransferase family protein, partial [Micromonosporaceae bacterium]